MDLLQSVMFTFEVTFIISTLYIRGPFFICSPQPKAHWSAFRYALVVRHPHSLNIFSSETAWPVKVKFYIEPPWDRGMKVCSNDPGHMTKMAAMPIYMVKENFKKSSLEPKGR